MQIFIRLLDKNLRVLDVDLEMTVRDIFMRLPADTRYQIHGVFKNSRGEMKVYLYNSNSIIRYEEEKTLREQGIEPEQSLELKVKPVKQYMWFNN